MSVENVDVVIVGARCAGTAAAVPLARAGRRVLVLDKVAFPSDTLSTHVFTPNGVSELARMGAAEFRADPEAAWQRKLDGDPEGVGKRLAGATNATPIRRTDDLSAYYRRSSGPGWALAGDSGHFKDPVAGQGMRDALRHGRLLGEAAAGALDDAHALDLALSRWECNRDKDTLSTYHWANRESRPIPTSPLVLEVLRTFTGDGSPDLSDTFNRARTIEQIISPTHLARGLTRALRAPGADRKAIVRNVLEELPHEISARRHRLLDGFRSTRRTSTERPGWTVGDPPGPPSRRPASTAEHRSKN